MGTDELPMASIMTQNWMNSLTIDDIDPISDLPGSVSEPADDRLPGQHPVMPDWVDPMFAAYFTQWQAMTAAGHYSADFGDYLRSHGVRPPRELLKREQIMKPELLRYIRDWKMPAPSMVGDTTGFNVRWDIAERIDKDRFFAEPGFIVGVSVARPKVYYGEQAGFLSSYMNTAYDWLPAVLNDEAYTSLKKFELGTGPLAHLNQAYWIDIKDLFMHGDTFMNFDPKGGGASNVSQGDHIVTLPSADFRRKYVEATEVSSQFVSATDTIAVDGVVTLDILSRLQDTTPPVWDQDDTAPDPAYVP
jgi:hypothetical protein